MAEQGQGDRSVLRVGVTGHRSNRLDAAALMRLVAPVEAVLGALSRQGWAERWLVSALADGADQTVSAVGVSLGYRLEVILPFAQEEYISNFPAVARLQFASLLAEGGPARVATMALPRGEHEAAFLAAGRRMLERSALLIALWDGAPARGLGGTGQIVAEARARGVPVCWIHPTGQVHLAGAGEEWQVPGKRLQAALCCLLPGCGEAYPG